LIFLQSQFTKHTYLYFEKIYLYVKSTWVSGFMIIPLKGDLLNLLFVVGCKNCRRYRRINNPHLSSRRNWTYSVFYYNSVWKEL